MNKFNFIEQIKGANKSIPCDLVIKNISIIDVFGQETFISDVGIKNGYIVGIGNYHGNEIIDGTGKYICPGLIDAHAHIESSLTTPAEYCKAALLHGVTSLIADPHEIANVLGLDGIKLMLKLSEGLPFNFFFMLPSCVPATSFENSGAILTSNDLSNLYSNAQVLGLAEVMDFPSVINCEEDMINKIYDAKNLNLRIDGHGAGLNMEALNAYCTANIRTDHECHLKEEVTDRIRRGMYVLIREGTVAKNLKELIKVASIKNSRRLCFCTDDRHIDDLILNGSIDSSIRYAIKAGLNPETAIQMASLNSAECYKLNDLGAIAPGYKADFIILNNLENFQIQSVYKDGQLVADNGILVKNNIPTPKIKTTNSLNIKDLLKDKLDITLYNKSIINVIKVIPNKLETIHLREPISSPSNKFIADIEKDLLKVAVIERHKGTGNVGVGIINGMELKSGAIATTIAHDSHNLIVVGTNDSDMLFATEKLKEIGGGIIVVEDGKVLSSIKLEIGGLITDRPINSIMNDLEELHNSIKKVAPTINFNPFLTLSFLSLPVIPDIKITDKGIFDVKKFDFIDIAQ
ncbi:MAG: adenine deaminase [Clostridium sp.]|uniref:adenine deaminase n=1 Tax=Clostridium TaxID=1485 RepID=UPI00189F61B2|nr:MULTISPECIES: adenine deaminase [Clostridium]MDU1032556.1 adenine deaminase [Clostridium sp.]MDU6808648.1 adenine deaminase [Clostridium sp.]